MTTTIAVVNNHAILIVNHGSKEMVPVRPICEALGIDFSAQLQRLKRDLILGSTMVTITTVGADEKNREMIVLPMKFVFGWLFTIDANQVKKESREAVLRYQMECYDALYNHFTSYSEFVNYREAEIETALDAFDEARAGFNMAKNRMKEAREQFDVKRKLSYSEYLATRSQLQINFTEESEAQS
jgi:hypothetical protein